MISLRKAEQLDATTMFTYSHANTPLGQSERAYYISYFINVYNAIINIPQYYTMENAIMLSAIYVTGVNGEW